MMQLDAIADARDWWLTEMLQAFGRARWQTRADSAQVLISVEDADIRIGRAADLQGVRTLTLPRMAASSDIVAALRASGIGRGSSVEILIAAPFVLSRDLDDKALPARRAMAMARLDLLAATPIDPDEVHVFVEAQAERQGCRYHVVKRKTLAPLLDALALVGAVPRSIAVMSGEAPSRADRQSVARLQRPRRWRRTALRLGAGVIALLVVATFVHLHWRYRAAAATLEAGIASAQAAAKAARQQLDLRYAAEGRVAALRSEKHASLAVIGALTEIARIIPDTAWATDVTLKDRQATVAGFAADATALIAPFEASAWFSTPEFVAPVTRVPGQEGERFAMRMQFE